jgi:hypothetical protein
VYSTVPPGDLSPNEPNPEQLGLPEISLSGSTKAPAPDEETLQQLRAMARSAASGTEDEIDRAKVFATNEQDADGVVSAGSHNGNPDTRVYLITMEGHFDPVRRTGSAPPVRYMAVVVGTDLKGRASSFGNTAADTSSLGPGIDLIG